LNFTRAKSGQKVVREKAVPFILLYLPDSWEYRTDRFHDALFVYFVIRLLI
jgi:hypothetical protein